MKLMNDYSWVRGVNYGQPRGEQLRRELGYGKRVGLNAVRTWLNRWEWEKDPDGYIARLVEYVRGCFECGYQVMPILFNGNGLNPDLFSEETRPSCEAFASAVVAALKDEPGLLMWDVMNEPACNPWIDFCSDPEEKERRRQMTWEFVRRSCDYVRAVDTSHNAITVGYTTSWEAEPTIESVDVLSFHDYSGTRRGIEANFSLAKSLGEKYGKPVLQTETGCLARCNPYDMVLETCEKYHMGWFVYELMIHGRCDSEHGVFYPDGTVRDPATIAAMMGCYRCRDLEVIIPGLPNREGAAERAVNGIKKALTEYTCDAFDYRPSNAEDLLEACELAANLLECCDVVPMACPPTAKINFWRKMLRDGKKPPLAEIRRFAYGLANTLKDACEIL